MGDREIKFLNATKFAETDPIFYGTIEFDNQSMTSATWTCRKDRYPHERCDYEKEEVLTLLQRAADFVKQMRGDLPVKGMEGAEIKVNPDEGSWWKGSGSYTRFGFHKNNGGKIGVIAEDQSATGKVWNGSYKRRPESHPESICFEDVIGYVNVSAKPANDAQGRPSVEAGAEVFVNRQWGHTPVACQHCETPGVYLLEVGPEDDPQLLVAIRAILDAATK